MRLAHDEVFDPVYRLFKFKPEDEVVMLANATNKGLASYTFLLLRISTGFGGCLRVLKQE